MASLPYNWRRLLGPAARAAAAGLLLLLAAVAFLWATTELPSPERLRARAARGSTRILDRRGQLLHEVLDPLGGRQRPVALDQIPLALQQATVAVEDASFYQNTGVDLRGVLRALWANLRSRQVVAGGSTITQQLARGFLLDPQLAQQRTLERKLREAVLALKLTASYSKDDILALYLNQSYYGGLSYGVEAAARHYFGKPARDLDLAESALLAGLPQAPARYDPHTNPEAALARQAQVLDAMVRQGYLTPAQAAAARSEPLQFAGGAEARAPHFVRYVLDQLDAEFGPELVARGGLVVTTTLDADLNDAAQDILARQLRLLALPQDGGPDHRARNGAVVVLDPSDGAILAMVGSPDFDNTAIQGQVNAALAPRQPGSAIKPLTYAAALERGWTPASTILDVPTTFRTREGRAYIPQNYDRAFHGPLSAREALATSSNVAAVRVLESIGVPALLELAERLGITTLGRDAGRYGLSLTLGGGEVTLLELSAAYGAFANGGRRVEPYAITSVWVVAAEGETRRAGDKEIATCSLSACLPFSPRQVLSPQVAFLITDILSDRYARRRAFGELSVLDLDRPAAAKTGTTSDWRDNWTVGYTPERVVGVWVGNADGRPMEAISGLSGAGPIWHDVMLAAHHGQPPTQFARPDGIVDAQICAEGGLLPGPACPATRQERFVAGSQPTRPDDTHLALAIDPLLGCRAPAGYPADRTAVRVFRVLPPEAHGWAVAAGLPSAPTQLCESVVDQNATDNDLARPGNVAGTGSILIPDLQPLAPAVQSPAPEAVFAFSPGVPPERQRIALQARAGPGASSVTIYMDGQPLATFAGPPYRAYWQLAPGQHTVSVAATDANGRVWHSDEVKFMVVQ